MAGSLARQNRVVSKRIWSLVFSRRAAIYHWFSGIFAEELSERQFSAYRNGEAEDWLQQFTLIDLEKEVQRLKKNIALWPQEGFTFLDLCADFAQLFLLDSKTAALPYASFYTEEGGQLYGEMESRMRCFLAENKLQIERSFKEPADHLAIYLAVISDWTERCVKNNTLGNTAKEQTDFLRQALLVWLPQFVKRCQNVPTKSDFYAAAASLLLGFIFADLEYLQRL